MMGRDENNINDRNFVSNTFFSISDAGFVHIPLLMLGIAMTFFLIALFTFHPHEARADNMESSQYQLDFTNINSGSNNQSSSSYNLGTTIGQFAAQEFSSSGYVVKAGFQYIHSIIPFTFSISDISIDLETLIPQTPSTATTDLTVSFGGAGQYQVTAIELTPLESADGSTIPDTSCNGGAQTCTETSADVWDSTSAYGFGYNMSGTDIPTDFLGSTYFRPFPDAESAENPAVVMNSTNVTDTSTATMTFKANISGTQEAGSYQTIIRFVATPSF